MAKKRPFFSSPWGAAQRVEKSPPGLGRAFAGGTPKKTVLELRK